MRPRIGLLLAALTATLASAAPAAAQSTQEALLTRLEQELLDAQIEQRISAHEGQTVYERMTLDFGASLRIGVAGLQSSAGQDSTLFQYEANVFTNLVVDGGHRFFGNLRFLYNQYDLDRSGNNQTGFLVPYGNRYWYEFDLKGLQRATEGAAGDLGLNVRAGRQFLNWNSGMVYSNDIYGVRVRGGIHAWSWEGMIGVTASSGFYDFDPARPGYDSNTDRTLHGIRGGYTFGPGLELYVSGFWQRDHNDPFADVELAPGLSYAHNFNFDSAYLSVGGSGTIGPDLLWTAEVIRETGSSQSRVYFTVSDGFIVAAQDEEAVEAYAGVLNMAWTPSGIDTRPRIDGTLAIGSGDQDRLAPAGSFSGNQNGTSDLAFQSLGYINTGLAAAPTIANLLMLRVGASTGIAINPRRPDAVRVGVDVFLFGKQKESAVMSIPSSPTDRFVGGEVDVKLDWRITSDVNFNIRAGVYFPGSGVPADTRHFVYGGVTYAF